MFAPPIIITSVASEKASSAEVRDENAHAPGVIKVWVTGNNDVIPVSQPSWRSDSYVLRPMITGLPTVRLLKYRKSHPFIPRNTTAVTDDLRSYSLSYD